MQTRESVMKKIILMYFFGLMFNQADLTTKLYDINLSIESSSSTDFDLNEITGYNIDEAVFYIFSANFPIDTQLRYACQNLAGSIIFETGGNGLSYQGLNTNHRYESSNECNFYNSGNSTLNGSLKIAVTAEFPIEDTGYIEEGFDFCLAPGNNLVAFPCDNPVSVETAIPELAQAEIEQIIGAGQAATNLNGQFIGSLSNFTPGEGYWFKSSSSMCFNYACAE